MEELHRQGWSVEDIAKVLRTAPLHPSTISAIKTAYALGYVCMFFYILLGCIIIISVELIKIECLFMAFV